MFRLSPATLRNWQATINGAGFGLTVAGQRFDYAWLPMGGLGQTQYFSVVITFGKKRGS